MINIILDQISQTATFKKSLSVGDIVITNYAPNNFQANPLYGRVEDISLVYEDDHVIKDLWEITFIAFFIPPILLKIRLSTNQMNGKEPWFKSGLERFFAPVEMIGFTDKTHLRLVKDTRESNEPVYS